MGLSLVSKDTTSLILTLLTIIFSGGAGQVLVSLLKRRGEVRQTSSDIDSKYAKVADDLITQLQKDGDNNRATVHELQGQVEQLRQRQEQNQLDHTRVLRDAHDENTNLVTRVARLQTELDIAHRQIRDLTER